MGWGEYLIFAVFSQCTSKINSIFVAVLFFFLLSIFSWSTPTPLVCASCIHVFLSAKCFPVHYFAILTALLSKGKQLRILLLSCFPLWQFLCPSPLSLDCLLALLTFLFQLAGFVHIRSLLFLMAYTSNPSTLCISTGNRIHTNRFGSKNLYLKIHLASPLIKFSYTSLPSYPNSTFLVLLDINCGFNCSVQCLCTLCSLPLIHSSLWPPGTTEIILQIKLSQARVWGLSISWASSQTWSLPTFLQLLS